MDGTQFPYLLHGLVKKLSGQNLTLLAGAARTADSNGSAVKVGGHRRLVVMLDYTAHGAGNIAGDKLDDIGFIRRAVLFDRNGFPLPFPVGKKIVTQGGVPRARSRIFEITVCGSEDPRPIAV